MAWVGLFFLAKVASRDGLRLQKGGSGWDINIVREKGGES